MKILIDSTHCHVDPCGIKRYIDCIKKELESRPQDNLTIHFFPLSFPFYDINDPQFTNYNKIIQHNFSRLEVFLFKITRNGFQKIKDINSLLPLTNSPIKKLFLKLKREVLRFSNQIINKPIDLRKKILANYDIVHCITNAFPDIIQANNSIIKCLTIHDIIPFVRPDFYQQFFATKDFKLSKEWLQFQTLTNKDIIFTDSEHSKNDICSFNNNINPNNVHVTHLAADANTFRPITDTNLINATKIKYNIPVNSPYILSIFSWDPRKNLEGTFTAFSQLIQSHNIQDLFLVLTGNTKHKVHHLIDTLPQNVKEKIILTNFVSDEDLAALLSNAFCFCFPSHYEGFGLPVLEALQCGTPTITSNSSSLPEVAGDAALLVNPDNPTEIAQAILAIYNSPELRKTLTQKGIEQAQKFSWKICAQKILEIYKKIHL